MGRSRRNPISMAINGKDRNEKFQFLTVGSMVEVSNDEEGFNGAWYVAKILKSLSKRRDKFLIRYQTLLSANDSNELLIETTNKSFIRPLPPPPAANQTYEPLDVVDAFHRDGWWKGVVSKVEVKNKFRRMYTVVFENPPEKFDFCSEDLRFHLAWTDGKWIRPPKQKRMEGLKIGKGMAVEVNLDGENLQDAWFPAIVVVEVGFNSFLVEYCRSKDDGADGHVKETVDSFHIRPLPPKLDVQKFDTLEAVDAFHDSCWRNGIIIAALKDGTYNVLLKFEEKEMKFTKSEIRPHLLWMNGRWVSLSRVIPSKAQHEEQSEHVDNRAKHSNVVLALKSSSTGQNRSEESSSVKKSRKNQLELSASKKIKKPALEREETLVSNSKRFRKENTVKPLSAKEYRAALKLMKSTEQGPNQQENERENGMAKKKERERNAQVMGQQVAAAVGEVKTNEDPAEFTIGVKHINNDPNSANPSRAEIASRHPHEETNIKTESNAFGQQDEGERHNFSAVKIELEDYPSKETELPTVKSMEHEGDREGKFEIFNRSSAVLKDQEMPFTKSSFLWRYIDSLKVFQFLPQNPHFQPLLECNEASREESALGHMLNFVNLVEKASKLQIDNPISLFDSCLNGLADLEMLGFDVKAVVDCINELLSFKRRQEQFDNRWKEIHRKIAQCDGEKAKLEEEINAIDKMMNELAEERATRVSQKVKEDSKSDFLQFYASTIKDDMFDVKQKFKGKVAAFGRYL